MPSFKKLQVSLYKKRAAMVLAVLAVTAVLYLVIQAGDWKNLKESLAFWKAKPQIEAVEAEKDAEQKRSSFEEFLDRASQQQLILRSTELVDDPIQNLIVRIDRQQKKIQIADKLIETGDARGMKFAILSKLTALRKRELFNFDNSLTSDESVAQLVEFAEQHLDSTEPDIEKESHLGHLAGLTVSELLRVDEPDFSISSNLLDSFTKLCKQHVNDSEISMELFGYLDRIYGYAPVSEHKQFTESFRDTYNESENENLKLLSSRIAQKLDESEFELVDIFNSIDSLQLEAAEKLRGQISDALDNETISEQGYVRLYGGIQDIARVRQYEVAYKLTEKLQAKIENEPALKTLAESNAKLQDQLQLSGQEFDFTGVVTMAGEPFSIRYPDAGLKAVLFMTHQTFSQADKVMFDVLKLVTRQIQAENFCMTAVYLDPGNISSANDSMRKVAQAISVVDFCRVDIHSEDGKKLVNRISLLRSPMMFLLDRDNKIVGVNVMPDDFNKTYFELSDR